jgi:hypothetical protein
MQAIDVQRDSAFVFRIILEMATQLRRATHDLCASQDNFGGENLDRDTKPLHFATKGHHAKHLDQKRGHCRPLIQWDLYTGA